MITRVLLISYITLIISCLAEPPSRLNLFRFFMGFGPETSQVSKISFNPDAGLRYREQYEKKYGPHGTLLIERFGKGMGPGILDINDIEAQINKTKEEVNEDLNRSSGKKKKVMKEKVKAISKNNTLTTEISLSK